MKIVVKFSDYFDFQKSKKLRKTSTTVEREIVVDYFPKSEFANSNLLGLYKCNFRMTLEYTDILT